MNYLDRLGLDLSADPRAVRRAYARELKLIDQEKDMPAFQALREAYEGALRWIEQAGRELPEPGPAPASPVQALEMFQGLASLDHARQVLLDSRPLNLQESEAFEAAVAGLLEGGWRPGHDHLFSAACEVFYWDGHQLPQYLDDLDSVAGAIDDLKYLRMQPEELRANHMRVIENLRREATPDLADLARDILLAERVFTLYPDLMYLTCAPQRVESWRKRLSQLVADVNRKEEEARATSQHPLARVALFLYIIAIPLGIFLGVTDYKFAREPVPRQLTVEEMNWITQNVEPISVDSPIEFEVRLNDRGEIKKLEVVGVPQGRINHVADAIRLGSPYPPEYPRAFRVRFPYL